MKEKLNIRNKWLHIRLNDEEHAIVNKQFKSTTETHLSTYARKLLLGNPMIKRVRDESLNDIITILAKLQKDINGIGNNYNQMVHKLHISDTVPQIRKWVMEYEKEKEKLHENIQEIKQFIEQTSKKWLR